MHRSQLTAATRKENLADRDLVFRDRRLQFDTRVYQRSTALRPVLYKQDTGRRIFVMCWLRFM